VRELHGAFAREEVASIAEDAAGGALREAAAVPYSWDRIGCPYAGAAEG